MRYARWCTFTLLLGSLLGCSSPQIQGRWLRTGGATEIGPKLPSGTLVLLGGRRALVEPNGYIRHEHVVTPEPLCGLIAVPTPVGDRIIGYGKHTVYRFDDPLGEPIALTRTSESTEIAGIAPGPGTVFVWPTSSNTSRPGFQLTSIDLTSNRRRGPCPAAESRPQRQPIPIHVLSRERKTLDEWPSLPIRDVAFRSTSDGVVFFAKAGMAITDDGGKTFQPATSIDPDKTRKLQRVARKGDELYVVATWNDHVWPLGKARVDIDRDEIGAFTPDPEERDPTLAWIAATHVDAMQIYLQGSTDPRGNVVVAHQVGQIINIARVDPDTGGIIEFVQHSLTPARPANPYSALDDLLYGLYSCRVAFLPEQGVLVCRSGVHGLPVEGPLKPTPIPTFNPPNGHLDILFRPGGGFAHTSACTPQEQSKGHHQFCVSGTGASFQTISVPSNTAIQNGLNVLDDGRLVYLESDKRPGAMSFVIIDERGALHPLPPIESQNYLGSTVSGSIELGSDGILRALTHSHRGVVQIQQPLRGKPSWNEHVHGNGQLHDGGGFMIAQSMSVSKDGGASWLEIGSYPQENVPRTDGLFTGETGINFGSWVRVGWNPGPEFAPPAPVAPASDIIEDEPVMPVKPPRQLICQRRQEIGSAPALWGKATRDAFFDRAWGASSSAEPWTTVSSGVYGARFGARFEQIARDTQTATHWRLAVLDLHDPTGPMVKWSGAAPPGTSPRAFLAGVHQMANRAFFTIVDESNGQWFTNHVALSAHTQPQFARIREEPGIRQRSVAMTSKDADPIYFSNDGQVFRWDMNGKPPRKIATSHIGGEAVFLGEPRSDDVPVIIKRASWASMNWLRGNGQTEPGVYPFEQWRQIPITMRDELPACGKNSTGTLFRQVLTPQPVVITLNETQIGRTVALKGIDHLVGPDVVHVDLRVGERAACIERIDMQVSTNDGEVTGRATRFLTTNLTDGSGHAIEAGPDAMIQKIECSLETRSSSAPK